MGVLGHEFYDKNANRPYPLDDRASGVSDEGTPLPQSLLVDCALRFPRSLGPYAYIGGIASTPSLITVTFLAAETGPWENTVPPISALGWVSVLKRDLVVGRHYPIVGQNSSVGGWVVFGPGTENLYTGRFSSTSQSGLLQRCARTYTPIPVISLGKEGVRPALQDTVTLEAGQDIEISPEIREINGQEVEAIVIRLKDQLNRNVFDLYRGPCGDRPESETCLRPNIERFGPAIPDCNGNIEIEFRGVETIPLEGGGGIGLRLAVSLGELCLANDRLPDEDGNLPNVYRDLCDSSDSDSVPSESSSSSSSDGSEGSESTPEDCHDLPFTDSFDVGPLHPAWDTKSGSFAFVADDCPSEEGGESDSDSLITSWDSSTSMESSSVTVEPPPESEDPPYGMWVVHEVMFSVPVEYPAPINRSLQSTSPSRRNTIVWDDCGYVTSINKRCETVLKLQPGPFRNGGIVVNWHRTGLTTLVEQYFLAMLNKDTDSLELRFYNGFTLGPSLASAGPLGIVVGHCYRLVVTTEPATGSNVRIQLSVQGITDPDFPEASIQVTTTLYGLHDGKFGLGSDRAVTTFSYFSLEEA